MECKRLRDWLLTDYYDKELRQDLREEVQRHLKRCPECRVFWEAVQKTGEPFKEAHEMLPEGRVWMGISRRIEAEKERSVAGARWMDFLAPWLRLPQPVFRMAFVAAMILMIVVATQWPSRYADPVYSYMSEQMTVMGELQRGDPEEGAWGDFDVYEEIMG